MKNFVLRPWQFLLIGMDGWINRRQQVSDQTVGNILKANGIEPAPERKRQSTWETFLKAHWDSVAAIDFTTIEIWTLRGLVTTVILVVMNLKIRRIEIAGVTAHPDSAWVRQMGSNLTDAQDGFLLNHSHILLSRGTKSSGFGKPADRSRW